MAAVELATAYVSIIPSTRGIGRAISKEFGAIERNASSVGKRIGDNLGKSAGASNVLKESFDITDMTRKAEADANRFATTLKKARQTQESATRKVGVAEARLVELQESGRAKKSQILAAEDNLARARNAQTEATFGVQKAELAASASSDEWTKKINTAKAATQTATTATQSFGDKAKSAFRSFHDNAVQQVDVVGERIKSGFKTAATVAGGAIVGVLGASIVRGFGRLTAIENAQAKLKGLGNDAKSVEVIMANAMVSVKGTAFGLDQAATTAAGAVAAGIKPGQQLEGVLKSVANSSAAAGIGMDEMGAIYNKVASLGKAQNDVLQQVADKGIPIYQALADQMGMTADEVFNAASKGKIGFEDFEQAMTAASGTVADEMGKTTTGALSNLWAALSRFGANLLGGVFPQIAPMFAGMTEKIDALGDSVGPVAAVITDKLLTGISGVVGWLQVWWPLLATIGAGLAGYAIAVGAVRLAITLWAAAQWVLNAAMAANPFGLVIAGIAALVTGVNLAYNKVGWFRTLIDGVWAGIKIAVGAVILWFQTYVQPVVSAVINALGTFFTWLYQNVIKPVFTGIKIYISIWWTAVSAIFNGVIWFVKTFLGPVFNILWQIVKISFQGIRSTIQIAWAIIKIAFNAIVGFVKTYLGPVFSGFYNYVIKPVWNGIKTVISFAWNSIIKPIFNAIVGFVRDHLQPRFNYLKATVLTVWAGIQAKIRAVWDFVSSKVFNPLERAVKNTLPDAFRAGKDAIGKAWDGLKAVAKKPVEFVVNTIINKGIIDNFNKIAKTFGADQIDRVKLPDGFASGGWTGRGSRLTPAGIVHADEYVIKKSSRRRIEKSAPGALDYMNRTGNFPAYGGYASGGRVGGTLIDAANWWVARGARGSRHPAFGGAVRSGHSRNSLHYQDRAVDLNFAAGTSAFEQGKFDKYLPEFKKLFPGIRVIWRAKNHFDHMHIDTGNGADIGNFSDAAKNGGGGFDIGAILNPFEGLLDKVTEGVGNSGFGKLIGEGAKKAISWPIEWLKSKASVVSDVAEKSFDFVKDKAAEAQVRAVAATYGWGGGEQWDALKWLVNKESSWNVNAANPSSSARGLFQKMTSIHGPVEKTVAGQAIWGLKYIRDRYGDPLRAMAHHKRKNWYANGGLVTPTLFDKGGALMPGTSLVSNKTGKPEYILPSRVTDALMGGNLVSGKSSEDHFHFHGPKPAEAMREYESTRRRRELLEVR